MTTIPLFAFHPTEYVNNPIIINQQHKMVAINTALEIDLTGQVCADSIGSKFFSGVGGQVDFNRGAAKAPGGKAIIALPSTAQDGTVSRIVTHLSPGAGVVTTRAGVYYVVTEYGVAYLHGKSVSERAMALISIAHPDFRAELLRASHRSQVSLHRTGRHGRQDSGRPEGTAHHLPAQRRHADQLPAHPPDRRAAHARAVLPAFRRRRFTTGS